MIPAYAIMFCTALRVQEPPKNGNDQCPYKAECKEVDRNAPLRCIDSAYKASTIAIRITAYSDEVRTAILTDIAPSWAKVAATDAAARNGMNIGSPFGVGGGQRKSALFWADEGRFGRVTIWPM
jgi:hypothetical protein